MNLNMQMQEVSLLLRQGIDMLYVAKVKISEENTETCSILNDLVRSNKFSVFVRLALEAYIDSREGLRVYNALAAQKSKSKKVTFQNDAHKHQAAPSGAPKLEQKSTHPVQEITILPTTPRPRRDNGSGQQGEEVTTADEQCVGTGRLNEMVMEKMFGPKNSQHAEA